ncbi:MAG: hypothetical protein JW959_05305 [Pirellulales bacterium]|nr:hypothetical protein [Pirellulales bacterium]
MKSTCRTTRNAFTLLEFEVAMVVFGIALIGLFPLTIVQSRVLRSLEEKCGTQGTWYLAPSTDRWAQKLGAAATLTAADPGPMPTAPTLEVDDGGADYSDTGWTEETDAAAFYDDRRRAAAGEGQTATWSFTDVPDGWYQVQATWTESAQQVDDARYCIYDGAELVGDTTVNQQTAPVGEEYEECVWQVLDTLYIENGSAQVKLHSQTDGEVVADGVRLALVENDVQILSVDRSLTSETVTVHVQIDVLVPE